MVHGWWLPSCKMTKTDDQEEGSIAEEKMRQVSEFFLCWSSNLCLHFLFWYFKIWRNSCEMMVVIHLHYNGQTFWINSHLALLCSLLFAIELKRLLQNRWTTNSHVIFWVLFSRLVPFFFFQVSPNDEFISYPVG